MLVYPSYSIETRDMMLTSGVDFEVVSSKESYYDWARVKMVDEFSEIIAPKNDDAVDIQLGYNDLNITVFSGYVQNNQNDGLICMDEMLKLQRVEITQTFINSTPQEIIEYVLAVAGITISVLDSTAYPRKSIVVAKKNGIDVIRQVNQVFQCKNKFYFSDKTFIWGEQQQEEQKEYFEFVQGQNIIDLNFDQGFWNLKTVAMPFVKHSQSISVVHSKVEGVYEVFKVRHYSENGFIRTELCFRG